MDIDKLRAMILGLHKEVEHIKRTFLGPQCVQIPPEYSAPHRPVSVPVNGNRLPRITPRPPTAAPRSRRAPRKLPSRPVMIF